MPGPLRRRWAPLATELFPRAPWGRVSSGQPGAGRLSYYMRYIAVDERPITVDDVRRAFAMEEGLARQACSKCSASLAPSWPYESRSVTPTPRKRSTLWTRSGVGYKTTAEVYCKPMARATTTPTA